jgi:signal transduction histidine kinase/CheY-like chemotaxis protein
MGSSSLSSAPALPPAPIGLGPPLAHREEAALQRLLAELREGRPPEPGQVARRARFVEVLAALGHLALEGEELEPLLATACRLVAETLSLDATALLETTAAHDQLVVRACAGCLEGAGGEPVGCGPGTQAGFAMDRHGSTATADVHANWPGDHFLARHGLAWSALVVLPGPAGPLGLLGAYAAGLRAFEPDELSFLEAAAACLSSAMVRHRSEQERQRLQARLAVADRMVSIGALAGGLAHELNNPLSYVTANLAFIAEEVTGLAKRLGAAGAGDAALAETAVQLVEAAADARDGVEKLRGLVLDLQTLARGDTGLLAPLDLSHVLGSAIRVAASETRRRARVECQLAATLPPVLANEARLGQVFLTLMINAAHAIPEGCASPQSIRVRSFTAPGPRVVVEVSDTGPGIPAGQLERVFDPTPGARAPGTGDGPGLSLCRSIVVALGGEIQVESQVGTGSTFRVLLPVAPGEPDEEPGPPQRPAPRRGRILVVDDETLVGTVLQRTLGGEFDVVSVTSGAAALARLRAGERYDLVFCDLLMPVMTGVELHAELERLDPALAGRMVFLTGGAFTPTTHAFLSRPGIVFIEKPFELEAIRGAIARRLDPP